MVHSDENSVMVECKVPHCGNYRRKVILVPFRPLPSAGSHSALPASTSSSSLASTSYPPLFVCRPHNSVCLLTLTTRIHHVRPSSRRFGRRFPLPSSPWFINIPFMKVFNVLRTGPKSTLSSDSEKRRSRPSRPSVPDTPPLSTVTPPSRDPRLKSTCPTIAPSSKTNRPLPTPKRSLPTSRRSTTMSPSGTTRFRLSRARL